MRKFLHIYLSAVMLICFTASVSSASIYIPYIPLPLYIDSFIPSASVGVSYLATFHRRGEPSVGWSYGGTLPPGLIFKAGYGYANISGTPTTPGTYNFWVTVRDSYGQSATSTGCIVVSDPNDPNKPPSIGKDSLEDGIPGTEYSDEIWAKNGKSPYTWQITLGNLPPGITFETSGRKIRFYGTLTDVKGTYTFTLKLTDAEGRTDEKQVSMKVAYPPMSISGWLPGDGYVGVPYSAPEAELSENYFSVNYGVAPYIWRISRGFIPPGMLLDVTGNGISISGTPTSPDTYNFTLSVTDGEGNTAEQDLTLKVDGDKISDELYIDGDFPDVIFSEWFSEWLNEEYKYDYYADSVFAEGGREPYTWTIIAGKIPQGLDLEFDSYYNCARLSGWPSNDSSYKDNEFILKIVDADGRSVMKKFSINVPDGLPGGSKNVKAPYTLPVISGNFAEATEGKSYSSIVTATKGTAPYTWSVTNAVIPEGLTLSFSDSKTGTGSGTTGKYARLTGTPKIGGEYASFMLKVTDAKGNTNARQFTIKLVQKPTVSGNLENSTVKSTYNGSVRVDGGTAPYTWTLSKGSLPEGLTFTATGDKAEIAGKPSKAGTFNFTVKVTDKNNIAATKAFTVKVTQTTLALTVPATIIRGKSYTWTPKASGGTSAYKWTISKGKLPDGLSINSSTGKITGKPTKAGTFNFTVKVTDKNNVAAAKAFTVKVTQTTLALTVPATIIRGKSYTWTPKASGGTSAYKWTISKGKLPNGLSINSSTGKITGKPSKAGTFNFTVKVTDKNNVAATKAFTVKVTQTTLTLTVPTTIIRGKSYTWTPKVSGGTSAYKWSISKGKLPDGLSINSSTGKITGKPTKAGTFNFTVKVTDKNNIAATKAFTVKVTQTTLDLTVPTTIIRGKSYTWTPKVTGGTSAYTWTISKGKLPDGLSINSSTGKITGKSTKAGTFNFTVKVTDKNNISATKVFTVKVTQTTITATIPATIKRGTSYTWTPKATGGTSAYTWTISKGSLPTGMKINASTGKITGKPTKTGKFSFTLKAKDKNNIAATKAFTVKVTESASTTAQAVKPKTTTQFETDTSINGLKSSIPVTLQTEELTSIQGNGTINLVATLSVESDDVVEAYEGRDSDLVKVKAGKVLTFIVGDWGVDVSLITVYVDDKAVESVKVEDSSFTLPAEIVHGDFKVCVKAVSGSIELESEEVYIISE